jgi:hypothetical protein
LFCTVPVPSFLQAVPTRDTKIQQVFYRLYQQETQKTAGILQAVLTRDTKNQQAPAFKNREFGTGRKDCRVYRRVAGIVEIFLTVAYSS